MVTKKFLRDALDTFLVAAFVVVLMDVDKLIAVGSTEQLVAVGVAIARAAAIAGVTAVRRNFELTRSS